MPSATTDIHSVPTLHYRSELMSSLMPTWFSLHICPLTGGEILAMAEPLLQRNFHPTVIVSGYCKALQKALEVCKQISRVIDVDNIKVRQCDILLYISLKFKLCRALSFCCTNKISLNWLDTSMTWSTLPFPLIQSLSLSFSLTLFLLITSVRSSVRSWLLLSAQSSRLVGGSRWWRWWELNWLIHR